MAILGWAFFLDASSLIFSNAKTVDIETETGVSAASSSWQCCALVVLGCFLTV